MTEQATSSRANAETMAERPLIEFVGVHKSYRTGSIEYQALNGVDLVVAPGEMVSIVGPSGSGKSTILNLITGIDRPTVGQVTVDGMPIGELSEEELATWRGTRVGIVFQFFQLLPTLTVQENVILPMELARRGTVGERFDRATHNLELVGLGDRRDRVPSELSGGEQQRVAIARALACEPVLLTGDEPTGNLDSETAHRMFDLLRRVNERGMTVVYVTHDTDLAAQADRMVTIRDGRIADER